MAKSQAAAARPVIAAWRTDAALHEELKAAAKNSGRPMSQELEALARQALEYRKRSPDSAAAQALEMATMAFLLAGDRYARDNNIPQPWSDNLESRRNAVLAACVALITHFVSSNAEQQALTVESLKGRIWTDIVNRPKRDEGRGP
jgi:hypothetical protein